MRPNSRLRLRASVLRIATLGLAFGGLVAKTPVQAADGSFDATFGTGGRTTFALSLGNSDYANVTLQTIDGKLLMAGSCSSSGCLARLNTDGSLDHTYGPLSLGSFVFDNVAGIPHPSNVYDMTLLPDGRVALVGCSGDEQTGAIYMVQADGTGLDVSVGNGNGYLVGTSGSANTSECPYAIRRQSDGKFVVMNHANLTGYGTVMLIARFKADLSGPDTSFGTNGLVNIAFGTNGASGNSDLPLALAVQSDDKIIVAGSSISMGAQTMSAARLLPDGQYDTSFGNADGRFYYNAGGQTSNVDAIALDGQGRIVMGGSLSTVSVQYQAIARLTTNGVLDASFSGGLVTYTFKNAGAENVTSLAATADSIIAAAQVPADGGSGTYFEVSRFDTAGHPVTSFGGNGHSYATFGTSNPSNQATSVIVTTLGIVVAGTAGTVSNPEFGIGRLQYEHIFGDSFE